MSQTGDEIVIDAIECINGQRDAMDPVQGVIADDRAFLDRDRDDDVVGPAEGIPDFIVQLNIGVVLG